VTKRFLSSPLTPLHALIEAQVERTPHAPAATCDDRTWTYERLDRRANQIARYLLAAGLRPEEPVGVWSERSLDLLAALPGVLKAGAAYMPMELRGSGAGLTAPSACRTRRSRLRAPSRFRAARAAIAWSWLRAELVTDGVTEPTASSPEKVLQSALAAESADCAHDANVGRT